MRVAQHRQIRQSKEIPNLSRRRDGRRRRRKHVDPRASQDGQPSRPGRPSSPAVSPRIRRRYNGAGRRRLTLIGTRTSPGRVATKQRQRMSVLHGPNQRRRLYGAEQMTAVVSTSSDSAARRVSSTSDALKVVRGRITRAFP